MGKKYICPASYTCAHKKYRQLRHCEAHDLAEPARMCIDIGVLCHASKDRTSKKLKMRRCEPYKSAIEKANEILNEE